jgi:phage gp46-like protein
MEQESKPVAIENWNDIQEMVEMSIGTDKGTWWADPDFGSGLRLLRQEGKVDGRTAGTLRLLILECTQWLADDGLVKKIECEAERTGKDKIVYVVTVFYANGKGSIKGEWDAV